MNVVILDTGCANLNSVKSAIARHGYEPVVSRDPDVVLRADKLFLPGVGTAQAAMDQIHERELVDLIPVPSQCSGFAWVCSCSAVVVKRATASNCWVLLKKTCQKWPITVYHCHIWAGTAFMRKRVTDCFAALRMALTSTSCTATPCR